MPDGNRGAASPALVDAHVHFHPGFDEVRFFRSASANFFAAAETMGLREPYTGVLTLTESIGSQAFHHFLDRGRRGRQGPLAFEPTEEEVSLVVRDLERDEADRIRLVVVAGAQLRTAEDLEVLAVPAPIRPPEGLPLEETIVRTLELGSVAILPWGFGKWLLGRGRVIRRLLESRREGDFLLSDTGHRPDLFPFPALLDRGERAAIPVLAGSDPLPLPGEDQRAGSSCFALALDGPHRTPGASLKRALTDLERSPPRFAKPVGVLRFLYTQGVMQARKRRERRER